MPKTLQQLQAEHNADVVKNEAVPVVEKYETMETISDQIWQVQEGYMNLPGKIKLGPGQRFRPTVKQVNQTRTGKGGLNGKARELTGAEYDQYNRGTKRSWGAGADIGIRDDKRFPMADGTRALALEAGLSESDFAGLEPAGSDGRYLRSQIEALIAERQLA